MVSIKSAWFANIFYTNGYGLYHLHVHLYHKNNLWGLEEKYLHTIFFFIKLVKKISLHEKANGCIHTLCFNWLSELLPRNPVTTPVSNIYIDLSFVSWKIKLRHLILMPKTFRKINKDHTITLIRSIFCVVCQLLLWLTVFLRESTL